MAHSPVRHGGAFRFPAGTTFPIWRPFMGIALAPPDDSGTKVQPPAEAEGEEAEVQGRIPADLSPLTDKDLSKTESDLIKEYTKARKSNTAEAAAEAAEIFEAIRAIRAEQTNRKAEAEAREAELTKMDEELFADPVAEGEGGEGEEEEGGEGDGEDPEAQTQPAPATVADITKGAKGKAPAKPAAKEPAQAEPVAADGARQKPRVASAGAAGQVVQPPAQRPRTPARHRLTITASGDIPGYSAGSPLDPEQVGDAFFLKAQALSGASGIAAGAHIPVATFHATFPEERILGGNEEENYAKMQAVVTPESNFGHPDQKALVAAGGICAPLEADYSLMVLATTVRPVRDSLARFQADRGGIRWISPPKLTNVSGASVVWTQANDVTPASPATKPFVTITCGAAQSAYINAVTLGLKVGNFTRRTFPEQFEAWYTLAQAMQARVAEQMLLDGISAGSTQLTVAQDLGAARDILSHLDLAGVGYRNRNRMARDATLQIILPGWAKDAIRADLTKQPDLEAPGLTAPNDSEIDGFFTDRNLAVTWYIDTPTTGPSQLIPTQNAGALNRWPATVQAFMFSPGSWVHLDGGTLDLGVEIRDSSLIATNDVMAFMETFENVAFLGVESLALQMPICVNGQASAPVALTGCSGS
jgi:hypothetical protein